ncbi:hypothetical protein Tco_1562907 [Tanacetum coccineum]
MITSSNPRNQATVQDGRVVVQNVQGRQNKGQGNNARGAGAVGYGEAQNRVSNANPGQAKQVKSMLLDEDVDAICEHHEEHGMQDDVQPSYVVGSHADYTSDSNMTPYDQYVKMKVEALKEAEHQSNQFALMCISK